MGYGNSTEVEAMGHKTTRITIFSILIFLLGLLFFLFKSNSCNPTPANCKDSFHELNNNNGFSIDCAPGAVAEVVNSPPAPKPGILCHCVSVPAPATNH